MLDWKDLWYATNSISMGNQKSSESKEQKETIVVSGQANAINFDHTPVLYSLQGLVFLILIFIVIAYYVRKAIKWVRSVNSQLKTLKLAVVKERAEQAV